MSARSGALLAAAVEVGVGGLLSSVGAGGLAATLGTILRTAGLAAAGGGVVPEAGGGEIDLRMAAAEAGVGGSA